MIHTREQQLRETLKRLAAIHAAEMSLLEESVAILQSELDSLTNPKSTAIAIENHAQESDKPTIDRSVMCVMFLGQRCFLGNTLMLTFMERLTRRPNIYISYEVLLNDVWNAFRDATSLLQVSDISSSHQLFFCVGMLNRFCEHSKQVPAAGTLQISV